VQSEALPLSRKRVLIVDDDPLIVRMLVNLFETNGGYQTSVARDGLNALKQVKQSPPDLVILDLGLPLLPGEAVCKEIKRDETTKNLPVIMLSGKCSETDRIIGKVIGADYYMAKPVEIPELLNIAKNILSRTNPA
jgi:DNA-binding response OmpR family regulator